MLGADEEEDPEESEKFDEHGQEEIHMRWRQRTF